MQMNIKFYALLSALFLTRAVRKFVAHNRFGFRIEANCPLVGLGLAGVTHIDRYFIKVVKSCSGHPKTCKSVKNR